MAKGVVTMINENPNRIELFEVKLGPHRKIKFAFFIGREHIFLSIWKFQLNSRTGVWFPLNKKMEGSGTTIPLTLYDNYKKIFQGFEDMKEKFNEALLEHF